MPLGAPLTPPRPTPTPPRPGGNSPSGTAPATSSAPRSSGTSSSSGTFGGWSTVPGARPVNSPQPGPTAGVYTRPTPTDPLLAWYQGAVDLNNSYYAQQLAGIRASGMGGGGGGGGGSGAANEYARRALDNDYARLAADMTLSVAQENKIGADSQLALTAYGDTQNNLVQRRLLAQRGQDLANTQANDRYGTAMQAAQLALDRTTRTTRSDATGRGATLTQGYRDALSEIQRTYNLSTDEAKKVLDNALASNQLSFDQTDAAIRNDNNTSVRARQAAMDDETMQRAQLTKEREYLQALASDYGIRADQLEAAMRAGAAASGVNYGRLMAQLASQENQANLDRQAANAALAFQVLQMGGMFASTPAPVAPTGTWTAPTLPAPPPAPGRGYGGSGGGNASGGAGGGGAGNGGGGPLGIKTR